MSGTSPMRAIRHARRLLPVLAACALAGITQAAPGSLRLAPGNPLATSTLDGLNAAGEFAALLAVEPLADGSVLALGHRVRSGLTEAVIIRLRADASLDTGFGAAGIAAFALSGAGAEARGIHAMPDGRIVVAGTRDGWPFLAQFDRVGHPLAGFGTDGVLSLPLLSVDSARFLALDFLPDHRMVVLGEALDGDGFHPLLARFLPDGAIDPSLDGDGVVVLRGLEARPARFGLDAQGRAVIGARVPGALVAVRVLMDGSIDQSFGTGGRATHASEQVSPLVAVVLRDDRVSLIERTHGRVTRFDPDGRLLAVYEVLSGGELTAVASAGGANYALGAETLVASGWYCELLLVEVASVGPPTLLDRLPVAGGVPASVLDLKVRDVRVYAAGFVQRDATSSFLLDTANLVTVQTQDALQPVQPTPPPAGDGADGSGGGGAQGLALLLLLAGSAFRRRVAAARPAPRWWRASSTRRA